MTGGSGASGPRAGFGARLGAAIIDGILTSIVVNGLALAFGQDLFTYERTGNSFSFHFGAQGPWAGLAFGLPILYYTFFEGSASGQTIGKKLVNIRVIDFSSGGQIGYGRAFLRWIGRLASAIVCGLGYFWMLWDKEKQTWHDKIANTLVVPTSAYPVEKWPG
jgi:uncharacterized RDD family membrane protein YckC